MLYENSTWNWLHVNFLLTKAFQKTKLKLLCVMWIWSILPAYCSPFVVGTYISVTMEMSLPFNNDFILTQ